MLCALIQDNVVVDKKELDEAGIQDAAGKFQLVIVIDGLDPIPKIGWQVINGELVDPDGVGNDGKVLLTKFAFFSRLTVAERIAIQTFADVGPAPYKYIMRDFQLALILTSHVDRSWGFVIDALNLLTAPGIAVLTTARKNEILNAPAKPTEIYRGK